ncbi:MAG: hypothetical protein HY318_19590, partial [Armatimonadetes bacterium]|nr:hypothetical protein [Armatimonadota bacterium]
MSQLSPIRTTSCPPRSLLIASALLLQLARPSMVALQAEPPKVAGPAVVVGKSASSLEGLVARELCCLLARVNDAVPRLITADQVRHTKEPWLIVVGTPQSNPLVRELLKRNLDGLGDQGFVLETTRHAGKRALVVSGATPVAVSYGVYTLLERYGFGFYLGGDVVPPKQALQPLDLHEEHQPVFATRGSLPWYNFFNSPTSWNFEDYQYFADQMAKMKNNFIGFHAYDYEPFCAYDFEGKMLGGQPLMNSSQSCWGTSPMKVDEFAFGTKEFFDTEYFGSRAAMDYRDSPDGIRKAQALLQRAFDYAKRRGIKVCLGFEVGGDPLNPETARHFELRLRHLLATYPMVDYVWLWQTEGMGSSGITPPDPASDFGAYMLRHRDEFSYLGSPNRVAEGCRLSYYFNLGYTIIKQLAPKTGVAVSGWGGDRWLQFSDFYLGFDKTLPKDVIFSALDNIDANAEPGVSAAYGKLSPDRQKWPIPWFEFDGDQWFPQAHTHAFSQLCPDAHKKGSQGLLAIHWQTRGVEEAAAYMAQFAWNPKLTFEEFYDELARKTVGDSRAGEMSQILRDLEGLGYRWTGGGGQSECCEPAGNFHWGSPPREENLEKLAGIRQRVVSLREEIKASGQFHGLERVEWLIHTIDFCVNYDRSVPKLRPGGVVDSLLTEAEALKNEDKQEEAKAKAQEALDVLRGSEFGEGLKAYARKVTTRGELGVLATIDARAFFSYRQLELRAEAFLGSLPPRDSSLLDPSDPPFVTVPVAPSIVEAGRPLTVQAIAVSNDPGRSLALDWRRIGGKGFKPVSARNSGRSCFYSRLPTKSARGLEYAMVVRDGSGATSYWPKEYPQKVLTTTVIPAEPARIYLSEPPSVDARGNLLLQAVVVDGEEKGVKRVLARYRVQGAASWQTAAMRPDFYNTFTARIATGGKSVECFIEAQNRLGLKSRFPAAGSQAPLVAKPDKEAPNPPSGLTASLNDEGTVSLSWQAREEIAQHGISHYVVERASEGDWQALGNVAIPEFIDSHVGVDKTYRYRVTGVDGAGNQSAPTQEASVAIVAGPAPSSPKELKAGAGAGRVVLSWEKAPLRAVAYRILRASGPTGNFGTLREVPADYWGSHNVTDVQVEAGTQYSYRVAAIDRTGVLCEPSAVVTATPRSNVTTPVLSLHFDGTVGSVEGWKGEVHGATSYQPAVAGQGLRFGNESWASVAHDSR